MDGLMYALYIILGLNAALIIGVILYLCFHQIYLFINRKKIEKLLEKREKENKERILLSQSLLDPIKISLKKGIVHE